MEMTFDDIRERIDIILIIGRVFQIHSWLGAQTYSDVQHQNLEPRFVQDLGVRGKYSQVVSDMFF